MAKKKTGISLNAYYLRCKNIDSWTIYCPNGHCAVRGMGPQHRYLGSWTCEMCHFRYPIGQMKLFPTRLTEADRASQPSSASFGSWTISEPERLTRANLERLSAMMRANPMPPMPASLVDDNYEEEPTF